MDFEKMAMRIAAEETAMGGRGDVLHGTGRDAELGPVAEMEETHHDLNSEDLENVDTRPQQ